MVVKGWWKIRKLALPLPKLEIQAGAVNRLRNQTDATTHEPAPSTPLHSSCFGVKSFLERVEGTKRLINCLGEFGSGRGGCARIRGGCEVGPEERVVYVPYVIIVPFSKTETTGGQM
jgi:hypothetical protein